MAPPPRCPNCALATTADARYCERCGRVLDGEPVPVPHWLLSTPAGDSSFVDLSVVAGVTDLGRHRARNEDALAVGRLGGTIAAVVCDGVSSTSRSDRAAVAAAEAGISTLLRVLADNGSPVSATTAGGQAAAVAAAASGASGDPNPPCCTYVSAVVTAETVVVGWVGDSPAYWISQDGGRRLTVDDSLAGRLSADGVPASDPRYTNPRAYALNRWLGADADRVAPRVTSFAPGGPGLVLVCSDGLSGYIDDGRIRVAELTSCAALAPAESARALLKLALENGGHDNITVAALAFPGGSTP